MILAPTGPLPTTETALSLEQFREDVRRGLRAPSRHIPSKYFYDDTGSRLFDEICTLPEYYPTRTELAIMRCHAVEMARLLGPRCFLIEYGSGSSVKTRLLLDQLIRPVAYIPVDISGAHLRRAAARLAHAYPQIEVLPLCADFTAPLHLSAAAPGARRIVYFPGSTIGNFTPDEACILLRRTAGMCGPGGGMLLGADLKKDPDVIEAAYNDGRGVTAAFNLNLLARVNRELGGDFRLDAFWHHAFYTPADARVEMHLVSRRAHQVRAAGEVLEFRDGESIRTEYSYKYNHADLRDLAFATGFEFRQAWTDDRGYFTVQYWTAR